MLSRFPRTILTAALAALALAACGGDYDSKDEGGGGTAGFAGGTFTMTIQDVADGCYDGAMKALVIPDPADLPTIAGVQIPGKAQLPGTVPLVDFNEPFDDVTNVAVEADGDNGLKTSADMVNSGIDINAADDAACLADVAFSAAFTFGAADALTGSATMKITEPADKTGCPARTGADTCAITITVTGAKQ